MIEKECQRNDLTELCETWDITTDDFYNFLDDACKIKIRKIAVVGVSFDSASHFLDKIVSSFNKNDIKRIKKSPREHYVELMNSDIYQVLPASESSKGYKFDKAYVQIRVDSGFIENILKYIVMIDAFPEYEQILYFE